MRRVKTAFCLLALLAQTTACTKKPAPPVESNAPPGEIRVGLALGKGGTNDKSFNAAALKGASEAERDFKIHLSVIRDLEDSQYEAAIKKLAENGFQLIITLGFTHAATLEKIAPQFPKTHFAIVDSTVDTPGIASLLFAEHEGSFLVGYIAGLKTVSNVVGFIGGMKSDLMRRFELGFREGVRYANPETKVVTRFIGDTLDAWQNPKLAHTLALEEISGGADVVYAAAGASNLGVFDAVEEKHKLAIGVDSNQDDLKPGYVLTSMLKRVDTAVYNTVKVEKGGRFTWGPKYFGLADKGVDYSLDRFNEKLITSAMRKKIEQVRHDILSGRISVSDYYVTKKLCPETPMNCDKQQRKFEETGRIVQ